MRKTEGATRHTLTRVALLAAIASLAVLLAVPATGAAARQTTLKASLTGEQMVPPGSGDPDGRGSARITIRGTRVCWRMQVRGIQRPHAAHIHAARRGREGPAIVPLFLTERSLERPRRGCERARPLEARDIARNPRRYYVNVHNEEFPNGAVRGQLSRVRSSRRPAFLF